MKVQCIVPDCISNEFKHHFTTYPFPKITYNKVNSNQPNLVSLRRINLWKKACKLPDDYNIEATEPRICYRHFVKQKPAKKMEMNDVDWVPTLNLNGECQVNELEQEDKDHEQENIKLLNAGIEQKETEDGGIISYVSLEDETQNPDICSMIYDQETGDILFVEPERSIVKSPSLEDKKPIITKLETKTPKKRKDEARKSLSDKKKPKILNRDAPKESDEEEPEIQETIISVVAEQNHQSCQTDVTMDRIKEMEMFWNENFLPPRKSTRSRKQRK